MYERLTNSKLEYLIRITIWEDSYPYELRVKKDVSDVAPNKNQVLMTKRFDIQLL